MHEFVALYQFCQLFFVVCYRSALNNKYINSLEFVFEFVISRMDVMIVIGVVTNGGRDIQRTAITRLNYLDQSKATILCYE